VFSKYIYTITHFNFSPSALELNYQGSIPVILRTGGPLDDVYADLPVLMLDNYEQVTAKLLTDTLRDFRANTSRFNFDKLTWPYWESKMRSTAKEPRAKPIPVGAKGRKEGWHRLLKGERKENIATETPFQIQSPFDPT
jgi:hypothetical protein